MDEGNHENQHLQPSRYEPPTNSPLAMVEYEMEEYDSELELSREEEKLVMTEEEKAEWKSAQCRSRYEVPFTRRKMQRIVRPYVHISFTRWQTEIRKPDELVKVQTINKMNAAREADNLPPLNAAGFEELWQEEHRASGLPELTCRQITKKWNEHSVRGLLEVKSMFDTDLEAEVAGTVLCILYVDFARLVRDESYGSHRTKIRFPGCRWLIDHVAAQIGYPDMTDNAAARYFVTRCSNEFKRIADDTKLRGAQCPEELVPVVDEYIHNAMRYTKPYPLSELPEGKLFYKYGKKRKDTSWLELECICHVDNKRNVIKWAVPKDACLCQGVNCRLIYTGDHLPARRKGHKRKRQKSITSNYTKRCKVTSKRFKGGEVTPRKRREGK